MKTPRILEEHLSICPANCYLQGQPHVEPHALAHARKRAADISDEKALDAFQ